MGSSLGGFYTLVLSSHVKKLIVNPAVYPGRYIKEYIGLGEQEYFCERDNGDKSFMIDDDFINLDV